MGAERQQVGVLPVTVVDPPLGLIYRRKPRAVSMTRPVKRCDARSADFFRPLDLLWASSECRQYERFEYYPICVVYLTSGRLFVGAPAGRALLPCEPLDDALGFSGESPKDSVALFVPTTMYDQIIHGRNFVAISLYRQAF